MSARGKVTVDVLGRDDWGKWEAFVREAPSGSVYSLPSYLEALCAAAGGSFHVLAAARGDELVGGIAVYERSTPLGPFVASRLLLYYNGFVLRDYQTRYPSDRTARQGEVVAALGDALARRGYGRLDVSSRSPVEDLRPLLATGWRVTPSYTYVVPLTDLESQWNRVEQNLRRLVERARGQGLEVTADDDFDSFHRLHVQTATRKGALVYLPEAEFRRFYAELRSRDLVRLFHARLPDGRLGASQLVLLGHPVTHTVAAAADPELQSTGANPFLRWSSFERLAADGFAANDLTDAMLPSVARFKAQLGGTLTPYFVARRPPSAAYRIQMTAYTTVIRRLRGARRRSRS